MDFPVRIDPLSGYNDSPGLAIPDPGATRNPLRNTPPALGSGLRVRLFVPCGEASIGAGVFGAVGPAFRGWRGNEDAKNLPKGGEFHLTGLALDNSGAFIDVRQRWTGYHSSVESPHLHSLHQMSM